MTQSDSIYSAGKQEKQHFVAETPIKAVLNYLVTEGVAADREKAQLVLHHFLGNSLMCEGMININEFKKLF